MKKLSEIIVTETNNHIKDDCNIEGYLNMIDSSPLNYKHLPIFFHCKNESDCTNDVTVSYL